MNFRRAAVLVWLVAASCSEDPHWRSEEFSSYYRQPSRRKDSGNLERKKIVTWQGMNSKSRRFLGILERNEILLEGTRRTREHYVILDRHFEQIGLVSAEGEFYRFDGQGRRIFIGEYPIENDSDRNMFMTGLKVFFGIPVHEEESAQKHYMALEEIDPYGDF